MRPLSVSCGWERRAREGGKEGRGGGGEYSELQQGGDGTGARH